MGNIVKLQPVTIEQVHTIPDWQPKITYFQPQLLNHNIESLWCEESACSAYMVNNFCYMW